MHQLGVTIALLGCNSLAVFGYLGYHGSDEQAIQVQGVSGDFCSPPCNAGACPTDPPSASDAKPINARAYAVPCDGLHKSSSRI